MTLSLQQRSVCIDNVSLNLTRQEFNLLHYLMLNKGIVLTYEQLYLMCWNEEYDGSAYVAIKNAIKRLRAKIAVAKREHIKIQNMRGVGFFLPVE